LAAAVTLYEKADFEGALKRFNKALALFDDWKTALGHRAMCRWNMGDRPGASGDAFVATHLRPNSAESFTARGLARFVLKDYAAADADFAEALKLDPDSAEAHFGLGSVASAKGEMGRALKELGQAARVNNDFATAFLVRGTVQERRKDFAAAIRDFDRVLEINPRFAWAHFYRGKCRREIKAYREALADFDAFLQENPDFSEALYLRSNVRFLAGDYAGAEADLSAVISLEPKRGLAYSNRGQARAQLGDRLGALADLKRALELLPDKRAKIQAAIDGIEGSQSQTRAQTAGALLEGGRSDAAAAPAPATEPSEPAYVTSEDGPVRKRAVRKAPAVDDDLEPASGRSAPAPEAQVPSSEPAQPAPSKVPTGKVRETATPAPVAAPKRAAGLDRLDEAAAAPADADPLINSPDEARPEPAVRKKPKAKQKAALDDDAPEPVRKGTAPADRPAGPGERTSGQEDALLIE
jgi:tetratricopeptide (TPR) repeat protein